jgi:4-hydroxy-3-polyprenylbenzoate decarboxylase
VTRYFVGITGASGHPYAEALIRALCEVGAEVDVSVTEAGCKVLRHELGVDAGEGGEQLAAALPRWLGPQVAERVRAYACDRIDAPAASGTALTGGAILCPCSMGTLARVAAGFSSNLVERAADVALKERRPLVVVPREAPLSELHLENLLRIARLGAVVVPASPGFYHLPRTLDDLVQHVVGKVLDALRVPHELTRRWQGIAPAPEDAGTGARAPRDPLGEPRPGPR